MLAVDASSVPPSNVASRFRPALGRVAVVISIPHLDADRGRGTRGDSGTGVPEPHTGGLLGQLRGVGGHVVEKVTVGHSRVAAAVHTLHRQVVVAVEGDGGVASGVLSVQRHTGDLAVDERVTGGAGGRVGAWVHAAPGTLDS